MTESRQQQVELANMAGIIERLEGELALGEEPAMGAYGDNAHHGDVDDPWLAGHAAGPSSSGSAAGVATGFFAGVRQAARQLEGLGARVNEIRLPDPRARTDVAMLITPAEASTFHARVFREPPQDLQPVARARLQVGFGISAYDYLQALRLRAKLTRPFNGLGLPAISVPCGFTAAGWHRRRPSLD